ncbi:hypothetical protein FHY52_20120 [Nocardia nova]|nr:hypothetical protein [Nocardia nova]
MTEHYLNRAQVAEILGVQPGGLELSSLPAPDVVVGPVNADGTIPRGSVRGWLLETIERHKAERAGCGRPRRREKP